MRAREGPPIKSEDERLNRLLDAVSRCLKSPCGSTLDETRSIEFHSSTGSKLTIPCSEAKRILVALESRGLVSGDLTEALILACNLEEE